MRRFTCSCGQQLYFDNSRCMRCNRVLGYDPLHETLLALEPLEGNVWRSLPAQARGSGLYRQCANYRDYQVCNWLIPADSPDDFCLACGLNQVIPSLHEPKNRQLWARLEAAKHRLVYTLLALRLPLQNKDQDPDKGLAFAFLEDRRSNPGSMEEFVATGHVDGLITINLAEADNVAREAAREELNEAYRTLLGHFRHESGHYYWERLIANSRWIGRFRELFGDETVDYAASLQRYYAGPRQSTWQDRYISAYAQAHPLEDWAESWAHYLHMVDVLETAAGFGLASSAPAETGFDQWIAEWIDLTIMMNELNRSMGLEDAYPFVLSGTVREKLRFVHQLVVPSPPPIG